MLNTDHVRANLDDPGLKDAAVAAARLLLNVAAGKSPGEEVTITLPAMAFLTVGTATLERLLQQRTPDDAPVGPGWPALPTTRPSDCKLYLGEFWYDMQDADDRAAFAAVLSDELAELAMRQQRVLAVALAGRPSDDPEAAFMAATLCLSTAMTVLGAHTHPVPAILAMVANMGASHAGIPHDVDAM